MSPVFIQKRLFIFAADYSLVNMGGLYVFLQQACGKGRKELPGICQFGKKRNGGILFNGLEQRSGASAETKGTGIGGKSHMFAFFLLFL